MGSGEFSRFVEVRWMRRIKEKGQIKWVPGPTLEVLDRHALEGVAEEFRYGSHPAGACHQCAHPVPKEFVERIRTPKLAFHSFMVNLNEVVVYTGNAQVMQPLLELVHQLAGFQHSDAGKQC